MRVPQENGAFSSSLINSPSFAGGLHVPQRIGRAVKDGKSIAVCTAALWGAGIAGFPEVPVIPEF